MRHIQKSRSRPLTPRKIDKDCNSSPGKLNETTNFEQKLIDQLTGKQLDLNQGFVESLQESVSKKR